jgi:hypothetical protein
LDFFTAWLNPKKNSNHNAQNDTAVMYVCELEQRICDDCRHNLEPLLPIYGTVEESFVTCRQQFLVQIGILKLQKYPAKT